MEPAAFLQLARALHAPGPAPEQLVALEATTPPSAAELRSALSRAYYAAFLVANEMLCTACEQALPATASAHDLVPKMLNNSQHRPFRKVASSLARLRHARNKADYDLTPNETERPDYVLDCLNEAQQIIDSCKDFAALDRTERAPFIQAIANWRRINGS